MEGEPNLARSKRLKFIRILMYLDALLLLLSLMMIDIRYFSFAGQQAILLRVLVLLLLFGILVFAEKRLTRYLRKQHHK